MRLFIFLFFLLFSISSQAQQKSFFDFSARQSNGTVLHFSKLKGKKILVVNTASECMLTPQYRKLQELYEEYGGDDFEILAFPCNDFGKQESGSNAQINEFCSQFEIGFILMEKITIKGENAHPLYQWLADSEQNGTLDAKVIWNFQKFMINPDGEVVDYLLPTSSPLNRKIINWLNE